MTEPAARNEPTEPTQATTPNITGAQAESRRRNGAKSKGPTSAEGKARSSQNALRHGMYARKATFIRSGVLREDPDEARAFQKEICSSLHPGNDPLLNYLAGTVATYFWRELRSRTWEADGLTVDVAGKSANRIAIWTSQLDGLRQARAALQAMMSGEAPGVEDAKWAVCHLSRDLDEDALGTVVDDPAFCAQVLADTLKRKYADDATAAEAVLIEGIELREMSIAAELEQQRPSVVHGIVASEFLKNLQRGQAHVSRETDRALRRFRDAKAAVEARQARTEEEDAH